MIFNPNFCLNALLWTCFLLHPVKTSPSKKRRAVTHGPVKKTATSGPSLSQTASNNQNQASSESKEDTEGDTGKNWEQDV